MSKILKTNIIYLLIFVLLYIKLFKKTTNNNKHNTYFNKLSLYSLSSFNYTLIGLLMLKYNISYYSQHFFPYFLILQGFISYFSDVLYTNNKYIYLLDCSFATYNLFLSCFIFHFTKSDLLILFLSILFFKLGHFFYFKHKYHLYQLFHTLWHFLLPIAAINKLTKNKHKHKHKHKH